MVRARRWLLRRRRRGGPGADARRDPELRAQREAAALRRGIAAYGRTAYGLYRSPGFVSGFLANQTGFSDADLEIVFKAREDMFEHDRSAARGEMATRGLIVFKHDSELGNAHAHSLFDRVKIKRKEGIEVPRAFSDYELTIDEAGMPAGVKMIRRV